MIGGRAEHGLRHRSIDLALDLCSPFEKVTSQQRHCRGVTGGVRLYCGRALAACAPRSRQLHVAAAAAAACLQCTRAKTVTAVTTADMTHTLISMRRWSCAPVRPPAPPPGGRSLAAAAEEAEEGERPPASPRDDTDRDCESAARHSRC